MDSVYLIEGAGKTKVGISSCPAKRIQTMQTGSPVPLTLVAEVKPPVQHYVHPYAVVLETEKEIHKFLKGRGLHSHGEWFDTSAAEIIELLGGFTTQDIHTFMERRKWEDAARWEVRNRDREVKRMLKRETLQAYRSTRDGTR